MEAIPFYMVGPVEPLSEDAVALVCDGDVSHAARADVLIVRMR